MKNRLFDCMVFYLRASEIRRRESGEYPPPLSAFTSNSEKSNLDHTNTAAVLRAYSTMTAGNIAMMTTHIVQYSVESTRELSANDPDGPD